MQPWVWLVIIVLVAAGFYLWRQSQEANDAVNQMIDSGDFFEDMNAEMAFSFGAGAMNQGNDREAIQAFRRGEALGHEESAHNLGELLERTGNTDEAIEVYERNLARGYSPSAISIALILRDRGKFEEAIQMVKTAEDGGVIDSSGSLAKLVQDMESQIARRNEAASTAD